MTLLKKWARYKIKSFIYCTNQIRAKNAIKNVNKNSLVYSIFVIFLIFWPLELRK